MYQRTKSINNNNKNFLLRQKSHYNNNFLQQNHCNINIHYKNHQNLKKNPLHLQNQNGVNKSKIPLPSNLYAQKNSRRNFPKLINQK